MIDRKMAVQEIERLFSQTGYPDGFLADFDQLECLATHRGRETFLVKEKGTQRLCVTKCYDTSIFRDLDLRYDPRSPGVPLRSGGIITELRQRNDAGRIKGDSIRKQNNKKSLWDDYKSPIGFFGSLAQTPVEAPHRPLCRGTAFSRPFLLVSISAFLPGTGA